MWAILTNTTVIENTPISLGLSIRASSTLTKNWTTVAPDEAKKLMICERRKLAICSGIQKKRRLWADSTATWLVCAERTDHKHRFTRRLLVFVINETHRADKMKKCRVSS